MKFLVIGEEAMYTSGPWRLYFYEGHDVAIYCSKKEGKEHLENLIPQVDSIEEGLKFLGKDGYLICEDEKSVTKYRQKGIKCYGGNAFTERLENDREFEMKVCQKAGIQIPDFHAVKTVDEAIAFIKKTPDQYVLKQTGHAPKTWNYVGKKEDGSDIIDQLEWIKLQPEFKTFGGKVPFMLQEFVDGIELACAAWWQYTDWFRDQHGDIVIEINKEHKKSEDDDNGLTCGEAGTVMKFTTEDRKLFQATLEKLTPILREFASDVCINIDANCGITEDGEVFLYELTPRQGYPACAMQEYLWEMPLADFFFDLIEGNKGNLTWKKGWGVITVLGAGSYPHEGSSHDGSYKDQPVHFPGKQWDRHIVPFYIKYDDKKDMYRIADYYEYVAGFTFVEPKISEANDKCVALMEKVDVRAPHFRHDIGKVFEKKELPILKKLGYIS